MPFIFEAHIFNRHVALAKCCYDLFSLVNQHAGIIRAMTHKKRSGNAIYFVYRRYLLQEIPVVL
jgi:hypothetical protein